MFDLGSSVDFNGIGSGRRFYKSKLLQISIADRSYLLLCFVVCVYIPADSID